MLRRMDSWPAESWPVPESRESFKMIVPGVMELALRFWNERFRAIGRHKVDDR